MITEVRNELEMKSFGERMGSLLRGGEVIELVGDVGAGKTTLTKGIAKGLGIEEDVLSPTFTISRVYDTPSDLRLSHYDFYRLADAGIMSDDLYETVNDPRGVTIIEWAEVVNGVLPSDRLTIHISSPTETDRKIECIAHGEKSKHFLDGLS